MLLFSVHRLTLTGSPRRALPWAVEITQYVNDHGSIPATLWAGNFGYPLGTVIWSAAVESQAALEAATAPLLADPGYLDLLDAAADLITTPGYDVLPRSALRSPGRSTGCRVGSQHHRGDRRRRSYGRRPRVGRRGRPARRERGRVTCGRAHGCVRHPRWGRLDRRPAECRGQRRGPRQAECRRRIPEQDQGHQGPVHPGFRPGQAGLAHRLTSGGGGLRRGAGRAGRRRSRHGSRHTVCTWLASRAVLSYSTTPRGRARGSSAAGAVPARRPTAVHVVERVAGELGDLVGGDVVGQPLDVQPQQRVEHSRCSACIAPAASPWVVGERHRLEVGRIDPRRLLETLLGPLGSRRSRRRTAAARSAERDRLIASASDGRLPPTMSVGAPADDRHAALVARRASGSAHGPGPRPRRAGAADADRATASWPDRHRRRAASSRQLAVDDREVERHVMATEAASSTCRSLRVPKTRT